MTYRTICPKYNAPIMPDEDNNCSLCGAPNQHADLWVSDPNGQYTVIDPDGIIWATVRLAAAQEER